MVMMDDEDSSSWEEQNISEKGAERIYVSVRVRPLSDKEINRKDDYSDWECINETTLIFKNTIAERSLFPTAYTYDRVFGPASPTNEVYEEGVKDVALSTLSGLNATIFAYGQTSSGKTYTMNGITDLAVRDIYKYIEKHPERDFVLKFSAMEIYNEVVTDLLSSDNSPLRILDDPEKGMVVEKLVEERIEDKSHLDKLLSICQAHRRVGETMMNDESSRSHQIVKLVIESCSRDSVSKDTKSSLLASLNLVDLAGSERASQAFSSGSRLKEGCHINRSLFTLGMVIRKLSDARTKNGHIPFRSSKLTRLLQHALGGNARTAMICTMSPARSHCEQSKSTLFFASCAKEVATSAHVNVVMSEKALVKHLQKEVSRLESELRAPRHSTSSHFEAMLKEKDRQIQKLEQEVKKLAQQRDTAQRRVEELLQRVTTKDQMNGWGPISNGETCSSNQGLNTCERDCRLSDVSSTGRGDWQSHSCSRENEEIEVSSSSTPIKHPISESVMHPLTLVQEIRKLEHLEKEIGKDASRALAALQREVQSLQIVQTGTGRASSSSNVSNSREGTVSSCFNKENLIPSPEKIASLRDEMARLKGSANTEETIAELEEHLQSLERSIDGLVSPLSGESSALVLSSVYESRDPPLARSTSCKDDSMPSSPNSWSSDKSLRRHSHPVGVGGSKKRLFDKDGGLEIDKPCANVNNVKSLLKGGSAEENVNNIRSYVSELKERVVKLRYQKQLLACQMTELDVDGGLADKKSMTDRIVGISPNLLSPSKWSLEFELQRNQIFELWDACHVSMVHRSHFFLLFKGEPSDAIYLEVELRRLVFLKESFSKDQKRRTSRDDTQSPMLPSSIKALKHEREMLAKLMQKKLSTAEREILFKKWGISLRSKQRRLQLTQRLWTDTKNITQVNDSADLVARLVGFWEPGCVSKEMFELSFTPLKSNHKMLSSGWNIISHLLNF